MKFFVTREIKNTESLRKLVLIHHLQTDIITKSLQSIKKDQIVSIGEKSGQRKRVIHVIRRRQAMLLVIQYDTPPATKELVSAIQTLDGLPQSFGEILELVRRYTGLGGPSPSDLQSVTAQVLVMTHVQLRAHFPWPSFAVSAKHDGLHCILLSVKGKGVIISNNKYRPIGVQGVHQGLLMIEGEIVGDVLYIYDCVVFDGHSIANQSYAQRLDTVMGLKSLRVQGLRVVNDGKRFATDKKQLKLIINDILDTDTGASPIDGVIFQSNASYQKQVLFKWKPASLCTVDFLVRDGKLFAKTSNAVMSGYHIPEKDCISLNSIRHAVFRPTISTAITVDPTLLRRLDGKVCEFQLKPAKGNQPAEWTLYKERPDKLSANSYLGAQQIHAYLQNPITPEQLSNGPTGYFGTESGDQYKNMRRYMSAVKLAVINRYLPKKNVLDLGIGRGQDLMKYSHAGVSSLVGVDYDVCALQELVYRMISIVQSKQQPCPVFLHAQDLGSATLNQLERLSNGVNAVCSFFSFHYYAANKALYQMLGGLPSGSLFILSIVDSERVQELLAGKSSHKSKYYEYKVSGRVLTLRLPFAEEPYSEEMIDIPALISTLGSIKYELIDQGNFAEDALADNKDVKKLRDACSVHDLSHIGIYRALVFRKNR